MADKKRKNRTSGDIDLAQGMNNRGDAASPSNAHHRATTGYLGPNGYAPQQTKGAAAYSSASDGANSSKRTVLIVLGVVIAAIAIWLLIWVFACGGPGIFDPTAQNGQAPYKTEEEIQAELNRTVEEGMFNISIASAIQFVDGRSEGTAYIENVPGNQYLMKVRITDDATGELLYESGVLKPNQYIENIVLVKELDQGSYPATATFTAMDQTTYEEIGQAAAKVVVNIEN